MRTDHAHPVAVDQWSVERIVARLTDEAAAMRRFAFRVACTAVLALCLAIAALWVAAYAAAGSRNTAERLRRVEITVFTPDAEFGRHFPPPTPK